MINITLLKAYLKGSNDPFVLAKAYYDELILKDAASVGTMIAETLGFDMEEDIKIWTEHLEHNEEEFSFWSKQLKTLAPIWDGLLELFEGLDVSAPDATRTTERNIAEESELAPGTYDHQGFMETIPYEALPEYLKHFQREIEWANTQIDEAEKDYAETVKDITGMGVDEWEQRGTFDEDEIFQPWNDETFIKIHDMGLNYIDDKIEYYTNEFQRQKDNKDIPSIRPEALDKLEQELNNLWATWEKMNIESRPSPSQKQTLLKDIEDRYKILLADKTDVEEWKFFESELQTWNSRKERSEKKLEKYLKHQEGDKSLQELRQLGKKSKLKYDSQKELWWKFSTTKENKKIPEHSREKRWYDYNKETNKFELVKTPPKEDKGRTEYQYFSSESWWQTLADTSKPDLVINNRKVSPKGFKAALKAFFRNAGPEFNKEPKPGKTASGIGRIEFDNNRQKVVQENPTVRLKNLRTLLNIFESLPNEQQSNMNVRIIMGVINSEMGYQQDELDRKAQGKLSNTNKGVEITTRLVKHLESAYNKAKNYTDSRNFPIKFLNDVSEIKKTGIKQKELKNFAEDKIVSDNEPKMTPFISNSDTHKEQFELNNKRRKYLQNTFDRSKKGFKDVVKWLNKPMKQGKRLIDLIVEAWDDKKVFKPSTGFSDEEKDAMASLMDDYAGELSEILDKQEGVIATQYKGHNKEGIEERIQWLKEVLEWIDGEKDQEIDDELFDHFEKMFIGFQEVVTSALKKLPKGDKDYKLIDELKHSVIDELTKIPELRDLITVDEIHSNVTPHNIIEQRLNAANGILNIISMKDSTMFAEGENPYEWLNQYMTRAPSSRYGSPKMSDDKQKLLMFVDSRLPIAETSKGKRQRENLMHKIIDIGLDNTDNWDEEDKDITNKDVNWDITETKARRIWGKSQGQSRQYAEDEPETGSTKEREDYDETDTGEREVTEMTGGQHDYDMTSQGLDYVEEFEEKPEEEEEDDNSPW